MITRYGWFKIPAALILALLLLVLSVTGCSYFNQTDQWKTKIEEKTIDPNTPQIPGEGINDPEEEESPEPEFEEGPSGQTRLTISVVGDIMVHSPQYNSARQPDGTYDFKEAFNEVKPYLEAADITMGNLETTISNPEKGYGGYPLFRTPEEILEALKYAGFDVLTTANNHSFDGREFGVEYTLKKLDEYGFLHTGTARTPEEREGVLIIDKNDIRVAILAYTYGTNGMETAISKERLPYMVNYLDDFDSIKADVKRAREAGAEIIIACPHWGTEYVRTPNQSQEEMAGTFFEAGVDIIFGSHPHVLQPMEKRKITTADGAEKDVFVIYSLGNFISNQRDRYKDSGIILNLEIVKDYDMGTVGIGNIDFIPTWVHKYTEGGRIVYKILPVKDSIEKGIDGPAGERLQAVWNETTEHLESDEIKAR